jgi:hypothetical protein
MNASGLNIVDGGGSGAGRTFSVTGFGSYGIGNSGQLAVVDGVNTQINTISGAAPFLFNYSNGVHAVSNNISSTGVWTATNVGAGDPTSLIVNNTAAAANATLQVKNDATRTFFLQIPGSSNAAYGVDIANCGLMYSGNVSQFVIMMDGAIPIIFANGTGAPAAERARFHATTGDFLINTTTDNGALTVAGVIAPEATGTRNLGTSSFKWNNFFLSGDANLTGAQFNNVTLVSATGNYNVTATDYNIVFTGSTATVVYPTATTGRTLEILNQASGSVTIPTTTTGNGATSTTLTTGQHIRVFYDGTVWRGRIN